jgi:hypothetical protein
MGFFKSEKGTVISEWFQLVEQHANLQPGCTYEVQLFEDHLTIKQKVGGKAQATLKYSQITDVFHGYKTEIANRPGSPLKRAVVGGLLFGGVGAVVGAVSADKDRTKKESHLYFIISYTSSTGEDRYIQFEDTRLYKGKKLANTLTQLCNITHDTVADKSPVEL